VEYLLDLIDDALGPDVCLITAIGVHGLSHMTTFRDKGDKSAFRSSPSFEKRFGTRFKVVMDSKEVAWLRLHELYAMRDTTR